MRISHKYKFVFLANPRTGSSSTRRFLDPFSDVKSKHISKTNDEFPFYHHITALELKRIFERRGWNWSSYKKFCVVRNPFDRLVSLFHFHVREGNIAQKDRLEKKLSGLFLNPKHDVLFCRYVQRIKPHHKLPQGLKTFICDEDGNQLVDKVLKFEELGTHLPDYIRSIGMPLNDQTLPQLNTSPNRSEYTRYYDKRTKALVADLYDYEIQKFGYKF